MKQKNKTLGFLIIVVSLVGFFSPFTSVNAQLGVCKNSRGEAIMPTLTYAQCERLIKNGTATWEGPRPSPTTTPSSNLSERGGLGQPLTFNACMEDKPVKDAAAETDCRIRFGNQPILPSSSINPCPAGQALDLNRKCVTPPETYKFLAPLPCDNTMPGCVKGQLTSFDPSVENPLSSYLNIMLRIFIGLCAVLAMGMIVLGGVEYMTSELISSKESGKQKITGAVLGLLLALGSYTILNTINPDLLNSELKTLKKVEIEVTLETPATAVITSSAPVSGPLPQCSEGVIKTAAGMVACKSMAQNIDNLINSAKNSNFNIGGGGFRSFEDQKQTRIANCKGNYTDPNAPCSPPTAIPGQSLHNSGLAFDLTCNGKLIETQDNACFVWLKANASKFGLSNFNKEPWHWSVNGR